MGWGWQGWTIRLSSATRTAKLVGDHHIPSRRSTEPAAWPDGLSKLQRILQQQGHAVEHKIVIVAKQKVRIQAFEPPKVERNQIAACAHYSLMSTGTETKGSRS
jgi:hypothetical protein